MLNYNVRIRCIGHDDDLRHFRTDDKEHAIKLIEHNVSEVMKMYNLEYDYLQIIIEPETH